MQPSKIEMMTSASPTALTRPPLPSSNRNPAASEPKAASSTISSETETAPHVDAIDWEAGFEKEADDTIQVEPGSVREAPSGMIDKETFFANFKGLFALGGIVPLPPLPLECLPIKPEEEAAARGASDALYDICAETPFLQWMLSPESEWAKRGFAILAFTGPKLMAVRAELGRAMAARAAREAGRKETPKPAPVMHPDRDPQAL